MNSLHCLLLRLLLTYLWLRFLACGVSTFMGRIVTRLSALFNNVATPGSNRNCATRIYDSFFQEHKGVIGSIFFLSGQSELRKVVLIVVLMALWCMRPCLCVLHSYLLLCVYTER